MYQPQARPAPAAACPIACSGTCPAVWAEALNACSQHARLTVHGNANPTVRSRSCATDVRRCDCPCCCHLLFVPSMCERDNRAVSCSACSCLSYETLYSIVSSTELSAHASHQRPCRSWGSDVSQLCLTVTVEHHTIFSEETRRERPRH
jgi:hypothetical protein